jgi:hypothetical protein
MTDDRAERAARPDDAPDGMNGYEAECWAEGYNASSREQVVLRQALTLMERLLAPGSNSVRGEHKRRARIFLQRWAALLRAGTPEGET